MMPELQRAFAQALQEDAPASYTITPQARATAERAASFLEYSAVNQAHGIEASFTGQGVHITPPRSAEEALPTDGQAGLSAESGAVAAWTLGLQLTEYGYDDATVPVSAAEMTVADNRIEYVRNEHALTEWYVNGPLGLEQGFTIDAPPSSPFVLRDSKYERSRH